MFCDPLLNYISCLILFSLGVAIGWELGYEEPVEREPIRFKYSDFDGDYIDCMSWHDGTGYVILEGDGTNRMTCADGHKSSDKHPIRPPVAFVRSITGGRLLHIKQLQPTRVHFP